MHIIGATNATANGQWHETMRGGLLDHVDHGCAAMRGRRDVEENHLVGALIIITAGQSDRVADRAQRAFFSAPEANAAGDFSIVHVKAGNDSFRQHELQRI